jgi:hypothetical protein
MKLTRFYFQCTSSVLTPTRNLHVEDRHHKGVRTVVCCVVLVVVMAVVVVVVLVMMVLMVVVLVVVYNRYLYSPITNNTY